MLRAVPLTILSADSTVKQLRSTILSSAIWRAWSSVIEATLVRLGWSEPLFTLAASRSWIATGGVLTTKSNDLSA